MEKKWIWSVPIIAEAFTLVYRAFKINEILWNPFELNKNIEDDNEHTSASWFPARKNTKNYSNEKRQILRI